MPQLRTVDLYCDDRCKLVAVHALDLKQGKFSQGLQFYGSITPLVVVVCRPDGNEVLAVAADNVGLDTLIQQHPGLEDLIQRACVDG